MFPIGVLNIFIFWAAERLSMFYIFRKPPLYTDYLTSSTINTMYYAVVMYLMVACWAYSNSNLFWSDEVQPLYDPNYLWPLENHLFKQFFTKLTPGTPLLLAFFASIAGIFLLSFEKTNEFVPKYFGQKKLNDLVKKVNEIEPYRLPYSQVLKDDQIMLINNERDTQKDLYL
jgi:hypothetical protein